MVNVSVIIPAYNADSCIENCLESLFRQTLKDYEIIIINDGSTDRTRELCEKYSRIYPKIKLINVNNGGVSNARNIGIKVASGKYIVFVDSDDCVKEYYLEKLVNDIEQKSADIALCGYEVVNEEKKVVSQYFLRDSLFRDEEIIKKVLEATDQPYWGMPWNKIFRRDIISRNNLSFDVSQTLGEDFSFILDYLKYANTVSFCEGVLYIYSKENSKSLSGKSRDDALEINMKIMHNYFQYFEKKNAQNEYKNAINAYVYKTIKMTLNAISNDDLLMKTIKEISMNQEITVMIAESYPKGIVSRLIKIFIDKPLLLYSFWKLKGLGRKLKQ